MTGGPHSLRQQDRRRHRGSTAVGAASAGASAGISIPGNDAGADGPERAVRDARRDRGTRRYNAGCGSAGGPLGAYTRVVALARG